LSAPAGGPPRAAAVAEVAAGSPGRPVLRLEPWERRMPGVVAGVTAVVAGHGAGSESDFGLTTGGAASAVTERYEELSRGLGLTSAAVARQVHGCVVAHLDCAPERGVHVQGEADGITTSGAGVLLVVTVADCVPVYLSGPGARALGLVHAGWRGTAAGAFEGAVRAMERRHGVVAEDLSVHLGPAICGPCYEVGPEVFRALGMVERGAGCLDLRDVLTDRALAAGVRPERLSRSPHCTRCGSAPLPLFSHRGQGSRAGRMAAFLGRIGPPGAGSGP